MAASISIFPAGVNLFSALLFILFPLLILMGAALGNTVDNKQHEIVSRLNVIHGCFLLK